MEGKIQCPLMKKEIEDGVCFDIHMVVEDGAPAWTVPKQVTDTPDYKNICLTCQNHKKD